MCCEVHDTVAGKRATLTHLLDVAFCCSLAEPDLAFRNAKPAGDRTQLIRCFRQRGQLLHLGHIGEVAAEKGADAGKLRSPTASHTRGQPGSGFRTPLTAPGTSVGTL